MRPLAPARSFRGVFPSAFPRVLPAFLVSLLSVTSCYSTGDGTAPPASTFYFPVGLAVSPGGNVLYAVNSDFDLQWNGGTLQSYDLNQIRLDTVAMIASG